METPTLPLREGPNLCERSERKFGGGVSSRAPLPEIFSRFARKYFDPPSRGGCNRRMASGQKNRKPRHMSWAFYSRKNGCSCERCSRHAFSIVGRQPAFRLSRLWLCVCRAPVLYPVECLPCGTSLLSRLQAPLAGSAYIAPALPERRVRVAVEKYSAQRTCLSIHNSGRDYVRNSCSAPFVLRQAHASTGSA